MIQNIEFFEIITQFYALLLYGGINLFDKHENVLSVMMLIYCMIDHYRIYQQCCVIIYLHYYVAVVLRIV